MKVLVFSEDSFYGLSLFSPNPFTRALRLLRGFSSVVSCQELGASYFSFSEPHPNSPIFPIANSQ